MGSANSRKLQSFSLYRMAKRFAILLMLAVASLCFFTFGQAWGEEYTSEDLSFSYTVKAGDYGEGVYVTALNSKGDVVFPGKVGDTPIVSVDIGVGEKWSGFGYGFGRPTDVTSADFSNCESLRHLNINGHSELALLDISNCYLLEYLDCNNTDVSTLSIPSSNLKELYVHACELTSLDLPESPQLEIIIAPVNDIVELELTGVSELTILEVSHNKLKRLVVEAPALETLNIQANELASLSLDCPALENLDASSNELTSIDTSKLTALRRLNVSFNAFADLNLASLSNLSTLNLSENSGMESLDVTSNTLQNLYCSGSGLTTLTLNAPNLHDLDCRDNSLSVLDLSRTRLQNIDCGSNIIERLVLPPGTTPLASLDCSNNRLKKLDFSRFPNFKYSGQYGPYLRCYGNYITNTDDLVSRFGDAVYDAGANTWTSFVFPQNEYDWADDFVYEYLEEDTLDSQKFIETYGNGSYFFGDGIYISDYIGQSRHVSLPSEIDGKPVIAFYAGSSGEAWRDAALQGNPVTSVDTDGATSLCVLDVSNAAIDGFSPDGNCTLIDTLSSLQIFICVSALEDGDGHALDFSNNELLTTVRCSNNQLSSVCLNESIAELDASGNQLEAVDIRGLDNLHTLVLGGNPLNYLNISTCPQLGDLDISLCDLPDFDFSSITSLTSLNCQLTGRTSLDVSDLEDLSVLICSGNEITSLDVSSNHSLSYLDCSNNKIADLSKLQAWLNEDGHYGVITPQSPDPDGTPTGPDGDDPSGDKPSAPSFSDVFESDWFYESAAFVAERGLIMGYAGTDSFGPYDTLTRAQAAVILWRYFSPEEANLYDSSQADNETGMPDVSERDWYTGAANWAVREGVINGVDMGGYRAFNPEGTITREQLCAIVGNAAAKYNGADVEGAPNARLDAMPDRGDVSDWAYESVAWALEAGVISGVDVSGARHVKPAQAVDRATMAAVMMNCINRDVV